MTLEEARSVAIARGYAVDVPIEVEEIRTRYGMVRRYFIKCPLNKRVGFDRHELYEDELCDNIKPTQTPYVHDIPEDTRVRLEVGVDSWGEFIGETYRFCSLICLAEFFTVHGDEERFKDFVNPATGK